MEKKKTIVLLHGFGEDHKIFDNQKKALAPYYHILTPDLPGSGVHNHFAWNDEEVSIEWLAEWVHQYLIGEAIASCIMLGHSMGGYITLAFAEKYPEILNAWGLIHSTAYADTDEKKNIRRKAIEFIREKGAHTFLKTAIPNLFGKEFATRHKELIVALVEDAKQFTPEALILYYEAMIARPDRSKVFEKTLLPVLMVAGQEDLAAPLHDLLKQALLPKVCHFHVLKSTGHMGMLEKPNEMSDIILNFMKTI